MPLSSPSEFRVYEAPADQWRSLNLRGHNPKEVTAFAQAKSFRGYDDQTLQSHATMAHLDRLDKIEMEGTICSPTRHLSELEDQDQGLRIVKQT